MGKYVAANPYPLVTLKWNPYQIEAFKALAARNCPRCGLTWQVKYGDVATKHCNVCKELGQRDYDRLTLMAGRQGGKTRWGTLAVIAELAMPQSNWWVTAPTYRDLTDFVEPAFFAQIPQQWVDRGDWSASDRILTLPNKSVVAFRSLENPQSLRGPTLDGMLMDEACQVSEAALDVGDAMLAIKQGVWIFTTTPQGEDWVYERLLVPTENHEPGYWAAKYKSVDNPIMSKDYIEQKRRSMSDEMFRQEYEADIVTFQGSIYGDLLSPCLVDDNQVREWIPEWPKLDASRVGVVGLDPGSDHPFAGSMLVITPHGIVVAGEHKQRRLSAMEHTVLLRRMTRGVQASWAMDRSQAQMMIEMAQHGIYAKPVEAGPGSVMAGIERVKSWMKSGQLRISTTACPETVKELRSYKWAKTEKNDGSTGRQEPYKRKDDLADALRYALMSWPHLPKLPEIVTTTRDLSKVPNDKMRLEIERMLKFEQHRTEEPKDGVAEFYGGDEEEHQHYDSMYG